VLTDHGLAAAIEDLTAETPLPVALALAEAGARAPGPTLVTPSEIRAAAHWWTYRSAKARRELGWTTRAHEDTVEDTVRYHEERLGDRLQRTGRRQPLGWRLLGRAMREVLR
jgi:dihydroflavonol-4-reductase